MVTYNVSTWQQFQRYAQQYFSQLWSTDLSPRKVLVGGSVWWNFDLVSADSRIVGDAKWLKGIKTPAAKWQGIGEYIWLLQKVSAQRVFLVFGQDPGVAQRYLTRVRPLTSPVEFYFLDQFGHRLL